MPKVIGVWNRKGGVGSTMLTGHFCFIAAELGLYVAGASVGGPGDLRHWLRPAKIPWFDARREKLPSDVDLLVLDVYSQTNYHEVLRPDIWLIPVDGQEADRRAVALLMFTGLGLHGLSRMGVVPPSSAWCLDLGWAFNFYLATGFVLSRASGTRHIERHLGRAEAAMARQHQLPLQF